MQLSGSILITFPSPFLHIVALNIILDDQNSVLAPRYVRKKHCLSASLSVFWERPGNNC